MYYEKFLSRLTKMTFLDYVKTSKNEFYLGSEMKSKKIERKSEI